jgi:putative DNA primase/helicase
MVATAMMEGNVRAKAGQTVRLLDVPAEGQFGCFDELHGFSDGAKFSDALKTAAQTHFGWASRQFLDRLTFEESNVNELLQEIKAKPGFQTSDGEGQEKRAAGRFALVALAGELATAYDITGWEHGDATRAAERGYSAWRSNRGQGNDERNQILRGLTDFVEKHGDSRFSAESDGMRTVVNRAGYIKFDSQGKRMYLFNASGMREALNGFDFERSTDALALMGIIQKPKSGTLKSAIHRIKGHSGRFYAVLEDALFGKDHELSCDEQSGPTGVTPATRDRSANVSPKPAPMLAGTLKTPETSESNGSVTMPANKQWEINARVEGGQESDPEARTDVGQKRQLGPSSPPEVLQYAKEYRAKGSGE